MDPDLGDPSAAFSPLPADHSTDEHSLLSPPVDDGDDAAAVGAFDVAESHLLGSPFDRALPMSVEEEAPHLHGSPAPQPLGVEPSYDAAAGEEALPTSVDAADHLDGSQAADPPAFESAGSSFYYVAGEETLPVSLEAVASGPAKRKRGRPPKSQGAARKTAVPKKKEEEEVCFICFDGGNLVVCDRRGCPKVYHPACINRDEAFFRSRSRWNCGWHICSICERASTYMCYTCTYSLCKSCIREASFFCVRDSKGFCETCYKTIMLIESNGQTNDEKATVDFDDRNSWEYLFKVYWLILKGKLSLAIDEIRNAKNPWKGSGTLVHNEETSDELYDANDDQEASSDSSSVHHEGSISSRKRARKRSRKSANGERPAKDVDIENKSLSEDHRWASQELLDFVAHMKNGDISVLSQFDVQALLLEYIKKKSLRDPHKKSQIVCDTRLRKLFGKERVGHFEMLKLLELHFLIKETTQKGTDDNQVGTMDSDHGQMDDEEYNILTTAIGSDKRRKTRKRLGERELQSNLDDYAAIDVHNINLIYLRRNLAEGLIDDDKFSEKIVGLFVRIRISGAVQKQEMYRLVQVVGTHVVARRYKVGKKSTDVSLEILNLNKEESLTIDAISNQEFTEDECRRLRQSIKCGLVRRLTVGDLLEKAKVLQEVRVNDWLESEKLRLSHLRDRASDLGRRKDLRECIEKLQILETPEERQRRLNQVPEIHTDPHMDPSYESPEEADDKKEDKFNRSREPLSQRRGKKLLSPGRGSISNYQWNGSAKILVTGRGAITESADDKMEELVSLGDRTKELSRNKKIVGWINNSETSKAHLHATKPDTSIWNVNQLVSKEEQSNDIPPGTMFTSSGVHVPPSSSENDKVWHYQDPSGTIQGPFSMIQLRKWSSTGYFPPDLRIWLTSQKQEESMLLTDILTKFHKDSQRQESQLTNIRQPSAFAGASANTGHDWDTGWRENNNPTLVSVKQNSNLWNVNQNDITNSTAGYKLPNIGRQAPQASNYIEPKCKLIAQDGRIGVSAEVWDSSKDTNAWYGQATSCNNRGPGFPGPFAGYNSPTYQVVGALAENIERSNKNQDHGSSWSSVRSGSVRPSGQGYEDPHPSWSPSNQHSHQFSLEYQKIQPANNARNQWANEAYGSPTPSPQPSSMNWASDQSHMTASAINSVQSVHLGWQAIPNAGLHKSGTGSMDPKGNAPLTNSVGGWGSNSTSNALNQSVASKDWVAESSTLIAAADTKQNFGKVDTLDDSSGTNHQKKPFEYNTTVSSTGSSAKSQFFGSSCPSPTPSGERDDSPPSQMNKPDPSKNWNEPSVTAVAESQVIVPDASFLASRPLDPNVPLISTEADAMSSVKSKDQVAEKITELEKLSFLSDETENSHPLSLKPDVLETDSVQNFESLLDNPDSSSTNAVSSGSRLTHTENPECFPGPMDVFKDTKSTEWSLASDMPASGMAEDVADKGWVTGSQNPNIGRATQGNQGWGKPEQANDSNIGAMAQGSANVGWGTAQVTRTVTGWTTPTPTQKSANANTGWATSAAHGNMSSNAGWGTPAASNSGWGATFKTSSDAESGWAVSATGYASQNGINTGWGTTLGSKNATWSSTTKYHDVSDSQQRHGGYRGGDVGGGGDNPQSRSYFGGSRGLPRGQGQRGVCKFYESGNCKKGASCNYLHP